MSQYAGNGSVPSATVAQAQGMISVQVPCTLDEALSILNARARSDERSVEQIANAVVAGEVRFDRRSRRGSQRRSHNRPRTGNVSVWRSQQLSVLSERLRAIPIGCGDTRLFSTGGRRVESSEGKPSSLRSSPDRIRPCSGSTSAPVPRSPSLHRRVKS